MTGLFRDIRGAGRMLASHRAFAAAATLTVALAVGGTIADRRAVSADPVDALSAD